MHLHSDERQEGDEPEQGILLIKRRDPGYIDVDLATDMKHLHELIQSIRDGYDLPQARVCFLKAMSSGHSREVCEQRF